MSPEQTLAHIQKILEEKKAEKIEVIDLTGKSALANYLVLANGMNTRHLKALGDYVSEFLKKDGVRPLRTEGEGVSEWTVMDYGDVIVHIMTEEMRNLYQLEKIWGFALPDKKKEEATPAAEEE